MVDRTNSVDTMVRLWPYINIMNVAGCTATTKQALSEENPRFPQSKYNPKFNLVRRMHI